MPHNIPIGSHPPYIHHKLISGKQIQADPSSSRKRVFQQSTSVNNSVITLNPFANKCVNNPTPENRDRLKSTEIFIRLLEQSLAVGETRKKLNPDSRPFKKRFFYNTAIVDNNKDKNS